jgi:aminoglycoside 6'-N-acetyltransferase I
MSGMPKPARQTWKIRRASEADLPVWANMLASLHQQSSLTELLEELRGLVVLSEPYVGFLAFDSQDRAVGMVDARVRNYAEGSPELRGAYLEDLWVEPHARGHGVGRSLLAAVEQWARAEGLQWLGSDTAPDNTSGIAWHDAVGFVEIERLVVFGKLLR